MKKLSIFISIHTALVTVVLSFLFQNISAQSFTDTTPTNILPETYVYGNTSSVYWADINNDKKLDLFLLETEHASRLFKNEGLNVFTTMPLPFSVGQHSAFGDYDKDGDIDIAMCGSPVKIYSNDGFGVFSVLPNNTIEMNNEGGAVDWGDCDNDGDLDLLSNSSVFRNNGGDSFTLMEAITITPTWEGTSKWGDYDNDGFIDVIISGSSANGNITKIYRNTGNGSFTEITGLDLTGGYFGSSDWGDYDNDGDLDLALTGWTGDYGFSKIYKNNGISNFTELIGLPFPTIFRGSIKWGDYDNDGDLDILISGFKSNSSIPPITSIYTNTGNDSFELYTGCEFTGVGKGSAKWGDYDGDGDLDIALMGTTFTPYQTIAKIYRNDIGLSNTSPAAPTGLGSYVDNYNVYLRWDEVTTDNTPSTSITYNLRIGTASKKNDVMPSNSFGDGTRRIVGFGNVWQNNSTTLKLPYGTYFWNVQAIDNGYAGGSFSSLEGTFSVVPAQAHTLNANILNTTSLKLKWARGTGERCVVFCKQTSLGTAAPLANTTYTADSEFGFGAQIGTSGWYTIYNGRADSVIVTGLLANKQYSIQVFEYSGILGTENYMALTSDGNPGVFSTSIFAEQTGITDLVNPISNNNAVWGDYDNDGFLDIFVLGSPSKIYRNNGNNTFTEKSTSFPSIERGSAAWGDIDKDGDKDIIITGLSITNPITKIYQNKGGDVFDELFPNSLTPVCWSAVALGDYDADGDLDILLNGATGITMHTAPVSKVYKNNGGGLFEEATSILLTGLNRGSVSWMDLDNDGDLDLINTGTSIDTISKTEIYKNNGAGNFVLSYEIPLLTYSSVSPGDYDNDGDLDLLISHLEGVAIYENLGNGTFQNHLSYQKLTGTYDVTCFAEWIDFNNDGYLDFVLTNPPFWFTRIYRNTKGQVETSSLSNWFTLHDGSLKKNGNGFVNIGDYDNDGDSDILLSLSDKFSIIANNLIMKSGSFSVNRAPMRPENSKATIIPTGVLFSWDPVQGDETAAEAMTYNVCVGKTKNIWDIIPRYPLATGPTMGNAQTGTTFLLKGLPSGKYYWRVEAIDQSYKAGTFTRLDSFEVKNVQPFFAADEVCDGLPTHFTDQSVATKGIATWLWDFGDGTPTSSVQNPVHTYTASGTYNVKLTITDNEDTVAFLIKSVNVKPKPLTDFTAPIKCQGIATPFTNTTNSNGLTVSSWFWDFGNGQTSIVQDPPTQPYLGAAEYTVTLKAMADNSCRDSITKTVTVAAYPSASVSADDVLTFCAGDSVTLSVPYNTNYLYIWKNNGTDLTGADSNKLTAKLTGNYTAEITNTSGNCTSLSSVVPIIANNSPTAPLISPVGPLTFCQGASVVLGVDQTSGYSYQWKLNGGAVGSNSNQYTASAAGAYSLVVTNASGCPVNSTNTVNVTVNQNPTLPTVNITGSTTFCEGNSVELSVTNTPGYTYQWENNGSAITGATAIALNTTSEGIFSLKVTNSAGCFLKTENVNVTVLESPSAPLISPAGPLTFCQGASAVLSVDQTSGYSYQWKLNGGAVGSNSNQYTASAAGAYSLVVTNASGCPVNSTNTVNVTVNQNPTLPTVNITGSTTFCEGNSVELSVTNTPGYTYQWENNGSAITGATAIALNTTSEGIFSLKVTNSAGCFLKTENVNVTVLESPSAPLISPAGPLTFCQGASAVLSVDQTSGYSYQWKLNGGAVGSNSNQYTANAAGTYSLVVTNASGCPVNSTNTVNVTVNQNPTLPTVNITGSTTFCEGNSVELSVTNTPGYVYQWENNGSAITGATAIALNTTSEGIFSLKVTNSAGCFLKTENVNVTVLESPSAPLISPAGPLTFCQGASAVLSVDQTSGYSYQWKLNGGAVGSNSNQYTANAAGTYSLVVTNASGCPVNSTNTVNVTVNQNPTLPTVNITGSTTFCEGNSVELSVTNTPGYVYQWENNGSAITGATAIALNTTSEGIFSLKVTNSAGCFLKTENVNVTVLESPSAPLISPAGPLTFCQGASAVLSVDQTSGYSYQWKLNGGAVGTNSNQFTANAAGTYSLVVTNVSGCPVNSVNTVSVNVTPAPTLPTVNVSGPTTFCKGQSVELSVAGTSGYTYQWENSGATIAGATTSTLNTNASGNYVLKVTNETGCYVKTENIGVKVVELPNTPLITYNTPLTFCQDDSVVISTDLVNGIALQWLKDGANIANATGTNVTVKTSGIYSVKAVNVNGCPSVSATLTVTVNPKPETPSLSYGATTFCEGNSITFSTDTVSALLYQWKNGNENITGATYSKYTADASGSYWLQVKNSFSCATNTSPIIVTVNKRPDFPVLNYDLNTTFCQGDSILINAEVATSITLNWLKDEIAIADATYSSIYIKSTGNYSLRTINPSGCERVSSPILVTVNPKPALPSLSYGETTFCEGENVTFETDAIDGLTYQWKNNGTSINGASSNKFMATENGNYVLFITNSNNCSVSTEPIKVTVDKKPATPIIKEQNNDTIFCPGTEVKLLVDNASTDFEYQWQRNRGNINGSNQSFLEGKLIEGDYTVVATSGTCEVESGKITLSTILAPEKPAIYARGPVEWLVMCGTNDASAYRWYYNGEIIPEAQSDMYFANKNLGDYYVEINEGAECWTMSDIINIPTGEITSEIPELMADAISVYPNPSDGKFQIALGGILSGNIKVDVLNAMGKTLQTSEYKSVNEFEIDLSNAKSGLYFCKMVHKGKMVMKKLVKE